MENKNILIAENGRPGAELLRRILTREGYNVDSAYNGGDGMEAKPWNIYLAPGERHMTVCCKNPAVKLLDEPPENHVKPAADPLFRSAAKTFGDKSTGVVPTGMGCNAALSAGNIKAASGLVIARDLKTAIIYSMPQSAIHAVSDAIVAQLAEIQEKTVRHINNNNKKAG